MLRWYLVHTKPSGEANAELNLTRQGYQVYFPRLIQTACSARRLRERIVALFPRYLFLHLNEGQQCLAPVHSTIGVNTVVRFGARYTVVPDEVIEDLRAREDSESGLHRARRRQLLRGSPVRIAAGPFEGLDAVFEREVGAERVVVLLKLLGHDTPVRVPAEFALPSMVV